MSSDAPFALLNPNPSLQPAPLPGTKKKRNLPGTPDPEAEVVALSPKSLMATNRFVCEVCGKGFQREQNLQLHRRGHNLPWKLRQRTPGKEARRKVYVCPEPGCVHHDPARALGDMTGVKKHYSRKHGEKKWKCERCSKRYAVRSDWTAHSKTCGSREYKCDCGVVFSRKDSFVTHRAFCDALTQESLLHYTPEDPVDPVVPNGDVISSSLSTASAHLSATALLQKAAEMGASTSSASASLFGGLMMGSAGSKGMWRREITGHENVGGGAGSGSTRDFLGLGGDGSGGGHQQQQLQDLQAKFGYMGGTGLDLL